MENHGHIGRILSQKVSVHSVAFHLQTIHLETAQGVRRRELKVFFQCLVFGVFCLPWQVETAEFVSLLQLVSAAEHRATRGNVANCINNLFELE